MTFPKYCHTNITKAIAEKPFPFFVCLQGPKWTAYSSLDAHHWIKEDCSHWSGFLLMKLCFESQYLDASSSQRVHHMSAHFLPSFSVMLVYVYNHVVWTKALLLLSSLFLLIDVVLLWVQSKNELYSTEQDILLQSVRIIKEHGARLGITTTSQWYSDNAGKRDSAWWSLDPYLQALNLNIILCRNLYHNVDSYVRVVLVHLKRRKKKKNCCGVTADKMQLKNRFSTFLTNSSWKFWIHLLSWKGIISFFLFCKEKTKKSEHASWGLFLLCVAIDYDSSLKERRLQIQPSWTEITHADSVACLLNTT
jgi:hypothetical protein